MISRKHLPILIALLISALIIGVSFYLVNRGDGDTESLSMDNVSEPEIDIPPIAADDHVLGNPNADIVLYVYSDFGCPHCKKYHETLHTVIDFYASDGRVAWVFRHMPLIQLHPNAPMYAHASECVAEDAGTAGFWKYADALYELADPLAPAEAAQLVLVAEQIGVQRNKFVSCMQSNRHMDHIEAEFQEAVDAGADGTPYTVITLHNQTVALEGAQDFRTLAAAIQTVLRTLDAIESGTIESPSAATQSPTPFSEQFKELDTSTSSDATTKPASSSSPSILDGIVDA